jgi:hypothetical protein
MLARSLLLTVAAAVLAVLSVKVLALWRRRRQLARLAHQLGLMFSPGDPLDLTWRCQAFALCRAGHGLRVRNVLHGHTEMGAFRGCEMSFEVGHGPTRLARRYSVMIFEPPGHLPTGLLWHGQDEPAPLSAGLSDRCAGPWRLAGAPQCTARLAEAFGGWADRPIHVEARQDALMLASPQRWSVRQWREVLAQASGAVGALQDKPIKAES